MGFADEIARAVAEAVRRGGGDHTEARQSGRAARQTIKAQTPPKTKKSGNGKSK